MDTIDELILKAMPNGFIVRGTHSYTDLKQAIEAYIAEQVKSELDWAIHQEQIHDPNGNPTYGIDWCVPRKVLIDRLDHLSKGDNHNE